LIPPQHPALGDYDQRNPSVISQHFAWSREANVHAWFTSWWGPDSLENDITLNHILNHPDDTTTTGPYRPQIAILYETTNRTANGTTMENLYTDVQYLARHYFGHSNYYKINNRPVIFLYLARYLKLLGLLQDGIDLLRAGAASMGYEHIYIIGDVVWQQYPGDHPQADENYFTLLDAVSTYDVRGSMGANGFAGRGTLVQYARQQRIWRGLANQHGCAFIPSVTPGFNDRAVRSIHTPLSRKLYPNWPFGSFFRAMLQISVPMVEPNYETTSSLLLVTSWNEWHEDTQIEPVVLSNASTNQPLKLTEGYSYEAYGKHYLQILNEETR
jgi:hypothetical protein